MRAYRLVRRLACRASGGEQRGHQTSLTVQQPSGRPLPPVAWRQRHSQPIRRLQRRRLCSRNLQEELARLRRENETLRMERDILKKAAAWFAKQQI